MRQLHLESYNFEKRQFKFLAEFDDGVFAYLFGTVEIHYEPASLPAYDEKFACAIDEMTVFKCNDAGVIVGHITDEDHLSEIVNGVLEREIEKEFFRQLDEIRRDVT